MCFKSIGVLYTPEEERFFLLVCICIVLLTINIVPEQSAENTALKPPVSKINMTLVGKTPEEDRTCVQTILENMLWDEAEKLRFIHKTMGLFLFSFLTVKNCRWPIDDLRANRHDLNNFDLMDSFSIAFVIPISHQLFSGVGMVRFA